MDFSKGLTLLSVCYFTAMVGLGSGLEIPLPFLKEGPTTGLKPSTILVLGGSSALGASAIQLLRLAIPDSKILVTASTKHHKLIIDTLGPDMVFDRCSSSLVTDIKAATPGSKGVDAILDTVGAGTTERHIFDAFDPDGPKRYAQVWTGDAEIEVPTGVNSVLFRSRDFLQLQGGKNILLALQTLLEEKKYKAPLPVQKVGERIDGLERGLDLMRKGVSGQKLVVVI
jgi:NADPH:quinone reductase-like Zn-dependent oxidoreductase